MAKKCRGYKRKDQDNIAEMKRLGKNYKKLRVDIHCKDAKKTQRARIQRLKASITQHEKCKNTKITQTLYKQRDQEILQKWRDKK